MPTGRIHGIFTPPVIINDEKGNINAPEFRRYIRWLIGKGIHGIFANGSTGEFTRYSFEEHKQLTKIITEEAKGRIWVIAGVSEINLNTAVEACGFYKKIGCDAVSLSSPYYFRLSQESIKEYFITVAKKSSLPVFIYNIPQFTNPVSPETIIQLAKHKNIIGIKDSSRDFPGLLSLMREIRGMRPDFVFITGTEEMMLPSMIMGADAGIIAVSGVVPEPVIKLYNAFKEGDIETAKDIQFELLPLIKAMLSIEFPEGFRAGVGLRGFNPGPGRQPLSDKQKKEMKKLETSLLPIIKKLTR